MFKTNPINNLNTIDTSDGFNQACINQSISPMVFKYGE